MKTLLGALTATERDLVRRTDKERLAALDEDALVELHRQVRRARNKYVGQYRREAAERGRTVDGGRTPGPADRRTTGRAEVFEDALARVSRRLALVARRSAADLRAERLAAARADAGAARAATAAGRSAVPRSGAARQRSASQG